MTTSEVYKEYESFVDKHFKKMDGSTEYLIHAALGIAGEAGEIVDCVKKEWIYGKPIDIENLEEELGDILFYIQAAANWLNISIEELMVINMIKLKQRYPEGYTDQAAQKRADKLKEGD